MRHRQHRRERFGNKGKWQEKKRNILEQKHKTEDNTHTRKSMGGNTNIKYMDGCTHAHQQTHTNTRTLSNYSSEKPLVSYISRPADESS